MGGLLPVKEKTKFGFTYYVDDGSSANTITTTEERSPLEYASEVGLSKKSNSYLLLSFELLAIVPLSFLSSYWFLVGIANPSWWDLNWNFTLGVSGFFCLVALWITLLSPTSILSERRAFGQTLIIFLLIGCVNALCTLIGMGGRFGLSHLIVGLPLIVAMHQIGRISGALDTAPK
jgi:hypothetical protein